MDITRDRSRGAPASISASLLQWHSDHAVARWNRAAGDIEMSVPCARVPVRNGVAIAEMLDSYGRTRAGLHGIRASRGRCHRRGGRRHAMQQINQSYLMLLSSHFQQYCRNLHSEAVGHLLGGIDPALHSFVSASLTVGRKLDQGNPNPGNLGADFGRAGDAPLARCDRDLPPSSDTKGSTRENDPLAKRNCPPRLHVGHPRARAGWAYGDHAPGSSGLSLQLQ
jgi:hypothetical protein